MANDATFSVSGFVATQPHIGYTKTGQKTVHLRLGWTPRWLDRATGEWTDQESSFVSVTCFRKIAEYASVSLRRGDPVVLRGTLRVREYGPEGSPKMRSVDVVAEQLGHDMSRGTSVFTRQSERREMTAAELERATQAAAEGAESQPGRDPLPGDRLAAERANSIRVAGGQDAGEEAVEDRADDDGRLTGAQRWEEAGPEADAEFEDLGEETAVQMMESAQDVPDPVGSAA